MRALTCAFVNAQRCSSSTCARTHPPKTCNFFTGEQLMNGSTHTDEQANTAQVARHKTQHKAPEHSKPTRIQHTFNCSSSALESSRLSSIASGACRVSCQPISNLVTGTFVSCHLENSTISRLQRFHWLGIGRAILGDGQRGAIFKATKWQHSRTFDLERSVYKRQVKKNFQRFCPSCGRPNGSLSTHYVPHLQLVGCGNGYQYAL